jgi:hypothetical protein
MEREDKKGMMPEEEYLKQMNSLPKVKAPEDFLKKVHERIERRSAFETIMRALFVPVKIKVPLEVAAMAAAIMLIVATSGIKKPAEQLAYAPRAETAGPALMKNEPVAENKIVMAEAGSSAADAVYINKGYVSAGLDVKDKVVAQAPAAENKPVELTLLVRAEGSVSLDRIEADVLRGSAAKEKALAPQSEMIPARRPYLTEALSKVKNQVELAQGKVTNVEMNKDTGTPQYVDAEIPAADYPKFVEKLASVGVLQEPILKETPRGQGIIRVRVKLLTK